MNFSEHHRVKPGRRLRLKDLDADDTGAIEKKKKAVSLLRASSKRLSELEYNLYAENKQALLIVLQGMDTAGKDGTIRHVMREVNPQSCRVTPFKVPSQEELDHDFLWRIHKAVPGKGEIGIFNRSHYEDVLVVRVHKLVPKAAWSKRYVHINRFEENLAANGVTLLKFFLHISKDEQKERLQARLDDPRKNWKFNPGDVEERKHWDEYVRAYEDVLSRCSTPAAPWFVIPANKKWYRNLAVSSIVVETLERMNPRLPRPPANLSGLVIE